MEIITVIRILAYTGPRKIVEREVRDSIQGEFRPRHSLVIRAYTLGELTPLLGTLQEEQERLNEATAEESGVGTS